jgi:hypothetical protein
MFELMSKGGLRLSHRVKLDYAWDNVQGLNEGPVYLAANFPVILQLPTRHRGDDATVRGVRPSVPYTTCVFKLLETY